MCVCKEDTYRVHMRVHTGVMRQSEEYLHFPVLPSIAARFSYELILLAFIAHCLGISCLQFTNSLILLSLSLLLMSIIISDGYPRQSSIGIDTRVIVNEKLSYRQYK